MIFSIYAQHFFYLIKYSLLALLFYNSESFRPNNLTVYLKKVENFWKSTKLFLK